MANGIQSKPTGLYREYIPDLQSERFVNMRKQDAYTYAEAFKKSAQPPWFHALYMHWMTLKQEPYKGLTNDGNVRPGLFKLRDEGVPIEKIVKATEKAIGYLNEKQHKAVHYHIDAPEWRTWSNPEFLLSDKGVRLDELSDEAKAAFLAVLEATLSPQGYQKALGAMRINGFLGELFSAPAVVNAYSYNFVLFGEGPSTDKPWGISFYGHHLCINMFFYKTQIVVSPCFTGAEPNEIDEGPYKGTKILQNEDALGLELMQSLSPELQAKAQIYKQLKDPEMPYGRWNHDDQRHLCGAYRDNRIVPYEGVIVGQMTAAQQSLIERILREYLLYLPEPAASIHLQDIKDWYHETYFSWIGSFGDNDRFYFRIQSPVIVVEFDHHSGVFLNNTEPQRFHIHTVMRTPNAGDYGQALRKVIPPYQQEFTWEGN